MTIALQHQLLRLLSCSEWRQWINLTMYLTLDTSRHLFLSTSCKAQAWYCNLKKKSTSKISHIKCYPWANWGRLMTNASYGVLFQWLWSSATSHASHKGLFHAESQSLAMSLGKVASWEEAPPQSCECIWTSENQVYDSNLPRRKE